MTFVYQAEGCGITFKRINDTMPHTCIMQYIGIEHTNSIYTRNRCCPLPSLMKTSTFSDKDIENTFNMSAILFNSIANVKRIF